MNEPLTEAQKTMVAGCAWDTHSHAAIKQALARLDFLERKVQAAEVLVEKLDGGSTSSIDRAMCAYDEVTDD